MRAVAPEHDALVRDSARRIARELRLSVEQDDLVGYGYQGLLEAEQRFDPAHGVRFEAFAYPRVRGAILDGVRSMAQHSKRAHDAHKAAAEQLMAMDSAMEQAGVDLEAKRREVGELDRAAMTAALDAMVGQLVSSYAVASVAEVERHESPEDALINDLDIIRMRRAVQALPDWARKLVRALYYEERTLSEAGRKLKISESYASRLHADALELLRQQLG